MRTLERSRTIQFDLRDKWYKPNIKRGIEEDRRGEETVVDLESRKKIIGLLARPPENIEFDSTNYLKARNKGYIERTAQHDHQVSKDIVRAVFRGKDGKPDKVVYLVQKIDQKTRGREINEQADSTCAQILSISARLGRFPEKVEWDRTEVSIVKGSIKKDESFEASIPFTEIKDDVLRISQIANKEREREIKKKERGKRVGARVIIFENWRNF